MSKRSQQSQPVGLSQEATPNDVLDWFRSFLSQEDYTQVAQGLEKSGEQPDGEVLLSCGEADLTNLGIKGFGLRRKIALHLRQAAELASQPPPTAPQDNNDDEKDHETENNSGLNNADEEEEDPEQETTTPAPTQPTIGSDEMIIPTTGAVAGPSTGGEAGPSGSRTVIRRIPRNLRQQSHLSAKRADIQPRVTRQRASRIAAIEQAATRMEVQVGAAATAAAEENTAGEMDADIDEDNPDAALAPETPDDGVRPENSNWDAAARRAMEEMLKTLPQDELVRICEEEGLGPGVYKYQAYNSTLQRKETRIRSRGYLAGKLTKQFFDGTQQGVSDAGSAIWGIMDDVFDKYIDESILVDYLNNNVKHLFASVPVIHNPRHLLRRLCCKPKASADPASVRIGTITIPYQHLGGALSQAWLSEVEKEGGAEHATLRLANAIGALSLQLDDAAPPVEGNVRVKNEDGTYSERAASSFTPDLVLVKNDEVDWIELLNDLNNLNRRGSGGSISSEVSFDTENQTMGVHIFAAFGTSTASAAAPIDTTSSQIIFNGCFVKNRTADSEAELIQVPFDKIVANLDHLKGTSVVEEELERVNQGWDDAAVALEDRNVPDTLDLSTPINFATFDKVMAGVEDLPRSLRNGLTTQARDSLALRLKPYQLHALSFMLDEEESTGGTARHLWVKIPLPEDPEVHCYVSPTLFQLRVYKSKREAELALGINGGGGWIALEMGMGKTAVVLAGIIMNPPAEDWRHSRPWVPHNPEGDHMTTVLDNMPRGGTLIIVPTTIVAQWENEINKTLKDPQDLNVLIWSDGKREMDCTVLAEYDVIITTPQSANKTPNLSSIFWHRIIIDEAQKDSASILQSKDFQWCSLHRWITTGTPCNESVDSIGPSLEFLRLGSWDAAQKYVPTVLSCCLRATMLRYTKDGKINGATNLELPPLTERTVLCSMNEVDKWLYGRYEKAVNADFVKKMKRAGIGMGLERQDDATVIRLFDNNGNKKARKGEANTRKLLDRLRAAAGGGYGLDNGETEYDPRLGKLVPVKVRTISKAEAIIADLKRLKRQEPDSKVLVFSEYPEVLSCVASRLHTIGLQHRSLFGSTSARKRGEAIAAFMEDPPTRVFLLSARAGGVGITLTAATHVYLMEPLMNPSLEQQAIGRSRRMGQTKPVTVTRLVLQESIEARLKTFLARRHGKMISTALAANAEATAVKINVLDFEQLFKVDPAYESEDEEEDEEGDEVVGDNGAMMMDSDVEDDDDDDDMY